MSPRRMTLLKAALLATVLMAPLAAAKETELVVYLHDTFHILPETILAEPGDTLRLTVQNADGPHNLYVCGDEGQDARAPPASCERLLGFTQTLGPNGTAPLTIEVPSTEGTYWYYCDVPGHRAQGMAGTLVAGDGVPDTKESPGAGALASLAVLGAAALVLRRRA